MDRNALRWGTGAWLGLRVVSLAGAFALRFLERSPGLGVPGYQPPELTGWLGQVAGPWIRADALWYLKIATAGYRAGDGTLAFFPAFPGLTWLFNQVVPNESIAALLAANLSSWLGLVLLYAFVARLVTAEAAAVSVVAVAIFPTAFFFVAPYGEAVLLAAGSASLLLALQGRGAGAFAAGFIAALARPFGAAIALPLAAICSEQNGWRRWLAPIGPVAGLAAFALYAWRLTGNPMALLATQGNWQRELTPIWTTLAGGLVAVRRWFGTELAGYLLFDLAATLFGIGLIPLVVVAVRRLGTGTSVRPAIGLAAYGAVALALPLSLPFRPRPLMSNPRFVLALFPLFFALVLLSSRVRYLLTILSGLGLLIGTALYLSGRPLF